MDLEVKKVEPGKSEILPELKFFIESSGKEERNHSFFYELTGYLVTEDGESIAYLNEYEKGPGNNSQKVKAINDQGQNSLL